MNVMEALFLDAGDNCESIAEYIHDFKFNGNWYPLQWYVKSKDTAFVPNDEDKELPKLVRMIWKGFNKIGVTVGLKEKIPYCIVVVFGGSNITPGAYSSNLIKETVNSKLYAGYLDEETLKQSMLNIHNGIRTKHGVSKVIWSEELEKHANDLLDRISKGEDDTNQARVYGVNMWYGEDIPTVLRVFDQWYGTHKHHKYKTKEPIAESVPYKLAPYCQLVWSETMAICAAMKKTKETYIIVVLYSPPGNVPRKFFDCVKKPKVKYLTYGSLLSLVLNA
ncbi:hypothetical protein HZS_6033 [Henneguya salminicola]|nr:hypothetical protein HZS_6033 [Henneguya salminicola]